VLSGLFRVRALTQDDAHIFVTEDQLEEELVNLIDLVDYFYKILILSIMQNFPQDLKNLWEKRKLWIKLRKH
jgi:threonyl-tRNA synthetase